MKNAFVKTKNVKNFVSLMDSLQKLPLNIPKLALVYGEHGLGKTHSIIWWATRNDAVYVRANNEMTQAALMRAIVDEVDYLIGNRNVIESLRDIQDNTGTPIVLVGMGAVDKKIARFKHFEDRLYKKLKFEHFNQTDIAEILEKLTDLKFSESAIEYLATRTNQFRQLVKLLEKLEKLSNTNSIKELDEYTLKGLINERANIQIMQKAEKLYA